MSSPNKHPPDKLKYNSRPQQSQPDDPLGPDGLKSIILVEHFILGRISSVCAWWCAREPLLRSRWCAPEFRASFTNAGARWSPHSLSRSPLSLSLTHTHTHSLTYTLSHCLTTNDVTLLLDGGPDFSTIIGFILFFIPNALRSFIFETYGRNWSNEFIW